MSFDMRRFISGFFVQPGAQAPVKEGTRERARKSAIGQGSNAMKIIKKGPAMRVIFFYPGEEGTYVDNAHVTLYENGIIHIESSQEETTTHLQNCEILWHFETDADDRSSKLRLLKPKSSGASSSDRAPSATTSSDDSKPTPPDFQ
jgi:hypothetical protein